MTAALTAGHPRWRTAARFLLRSLSLRGSTFVLALLAITVGATLTATMLDIRADLTAKMSRELRRFGPNLLLTPRADATAAATPITLSEADAAKAVRAVSDAGLETGEGGEPWLLASGTVGGAPATVMGADLRALRTSRPSWRITGAWPEKGDACLLGAALAARAGLAPGAVVRVVVAGTSGGPMALTVAGLVSTGESEEDAVLVPLARLQDATGLAGRVSVVGLSVDGGAEAVARAASAAAAAVPGISARPLRAVAASQGEVLGKLGRMMWLLTLLVMILSGLCLVTTLMTSVVEREREIGLMRSIGAGDFEIVAMFVGEVLLLGLVGGAAGVLLGAICARGIGTRLFGAAIDPRLEVVPIVMAISVLLCLVSVMIPLRRALGIAPAAALRGD